MKKLYVGTKIQIELPKCPFLYLHDEIPEIPRARIFNPLKDSFNPLKQIDHKKARELTEIIFTIYAKGSDTLTLQRGKMKLPQLLLDARRVDQIKGDDDVQPIINDILFSPVLKSILCSKMQFSFNANSTILARINRAELGDHDALLLTLLLVSQYNGQVIIPDFGFYGRPIHSYLIRQNRLIAGVQTLDQVPPELLPDLITTTVPQGTLYRDAVTLAEQAGLRPDPLREENPFNEFITTAMS
jgi:hypothetical protein